MQGILEAVGLAEAKDPIDEVWISNLFLEHFVFQRRKNGREILKEKWGGLIETSKVN